MSTPYAIAAVTKVLVNLLDAGLKAAKVSDVVGGVVKVSALSPTRIDVSGTNDPNQLNVFLYQALPNAGGTGFDLPTRDSAGARVRNTPLALDLYYLVTAYGSAGYLAEVALGHAMHFLHENPILAREGIVKWLTPSAAPTNLEKALFEAGLADQVESVKVSPEKITTEEVSRLWSAIGADYRPTAAYRVTVVLIESTASTKPGLPVRRRTVRVQTLDGPMLESLLSREKADEPALEDRPILPGHHLLLQGRGLAAPLTRVLLDGDALDLSDAFLSDEAIGFPLPAGLRAGPHGVQVVRDVALGDPPIPHRGSASNPLTFLLRPAITPPVAATATAITVRLDPKVTPEQTVSLLLSEASPPPAGPARGYTFPAPKDNGIDTSAGATETDTIAFPHAGVTPGAYLVRVQVDGADSVLAIGANGAFATPKVTVP